MKVYYELLVGILGVCVSGVHLSENDSIEAAYDSVNVGFPYFACDGRIAPMPDYKAPGRRVSKVKCMEYIWQIKYFQGQALRDIECPEPIVSFSGKTATKPLVIGGKSATHGEYPHMAALGWKANVGTWIFKCGSSLISEKFVLTAAHCSRVRRSDQTVADVEPKIVRLGSKSILGTVDGKPAYDIDILRFIAHERYNPLQQYFDIALVELVTEVTFNWKVHPSCLWSKFNNPEKGKVTGWGVTETSSLKTSPVLQKAEIKIVDSVECDKKLVVRRNRKWQGIKRHQLCAGDKTGRIDSCQGDSGGPLQSKIPLNSTKSINIYQIVGVTSFGFGCARKDTPSVYTRVASFLGWIENIVWPANITATNAVNDETFIFRTR